MLIGVITVGVLAYILVKIIQLNVNHWRYSHIPGPPRTSFFYGNAQEFRKRMLEEGSIGVCWLELVKQYGIVLRIWMVTEPMVFLADPLVIKEIVTDFKSFVKVGDKRSFIQRKYSFSLSRMGKQRFCGYNSILTDLGGPIWRRKKKIMDPAFSVQRLAEHLPKFYEISSRLCESVKAAQQNNPGAPVDARLIFGPFTTDAISSAGFSASRQQVQELRQWTVPKQAKTNLIFLGGQNPLALILNPQARKRISGIQDNIRTIRAVGEKMIVDRTSNGEFGKSKDILDSIISANINEQTGSLNLEESLDDFMTMYVAGRDTTITTLLWSIGVLTRNPAIMEKLVSEVDSVWVPADISESSTPTEISEALNNMTYLEAFIKEVLRYYPPVQFIRRRNSRKVKLCGYEIPAGTYITSSQYVLHRLEKFWDDPDEFFPERFINSTPQPYTYVPFFLGPRKCIGKNFAILELKCILCELLSEFYIEKDPNAPMKMASIQVLLCASRDNMYIFKPRD